MIRFWRNLTIRSRLTVWYAATSLLLLLLYGGGVLAFVWHSLSSELDRRLREDFEIAEAMLDRAADGTLRWRGNHAHPREELAEQLRVQAWSRSGERLFTSDSAEPLEEALPPPSSGNRERIRSVELDGGQTLRYLEAVHPIDGKPTIIRVIRENRAAGTVGRLALIEGLFLPAAAAIAALGGYGMARRALSPVTRMTAEARRITADQLDQRLSVDNPTDELGHLAAAFNETFERLERSFEQLRRFTADASHELRTPLASLRSVGEVTLQSGRTDAEYREALGGMLEEAERLSGLVESLLTLSRADRGELPVDPAPLDLSEVAREVAEDLVPLAAEKNQRISCDTEATVRAYGDRHLIRQAVANVVDNAVKYTPEAAVIHVAVERERAHGWIRVTDPGPGIAAEHQRHLFDRFYRVDDARARHLGGHGLGLSIARWAVEANGGRIHVRSNPGQGSTFRIVLPLCKP